jgi:hypothetical protein
MRDYLELATTTPVDEPCAQVGSDNYMANARMEAAAFRDQIYRAFGDPPAGTGIRVSSNPHDFGTYLDLQIVYDDDSEESCEWTFRVEADLPGKWDKEAKAQLELEGYKLAI